MEQQQYINTHILRSRTGADERCAHVRQATTVCVELAAAIAAADCITFSLYVDRRTLRVSQNIPALSSIRMQSDQHMQNECVQIYNMYYRHIPRIAHIQFGRRS